jgi:hypothetical protein
MQEFKLKDYTDPLSGLISSSEHKTMTRQAGNILHASPVDKKHHWWTNNDDKNPKIL